MLTVHNNPIEYYDPTGHWAWHVIGAAVGAVAGAGINLVADYLDDGKINRGTKSLFKSCRSWSISRSNPWIWLWSLCYECWYECCYNGSGTEQPLEWQIA